MDDKEIFRRLELALKQAKDIPMDRLDMRRVPPVATIPLPRRTTPAPLAPYVPNDPAKLANTTVQSVGRIGEASAEEIEKVREQLRIGYEEIDGKLQQLADAFRGHARIAEQHISSFCLQATDFFDTINSAHRKLKGREVAEQVPEEGEAETNDAPPEFLTRLQP